MYIRNWLRKIAGDADTLAKEHGLTADYRYRYSEKGQDVRLRIKVGHFDAAVVFRCCKDEMRIQIANLEPPFFETPIIKDYFVKHYPAAKFEDINTSLLKKEHVKIDLDGNDAEQWMVRFQTFVRDNLIEIISMLRDLKNHLEKMVKLTVFAEKEVGAILTRKNGWIIENKAKDLKKSDDLTIYRESWRTNASLNEYPPLIFQIIPESPCFDDLSLAVNCLGATSPDLERSLGTICGACDFAFGKADNQRPSALWQRKFDDTYHNTGGRWFDRHLLMDEERAEFGNYLRGIAAKLLQMEPIIAEVCQKRNEMDFIACFEAFVDRMAEYLKIHFPEGDGWVMHVDVKNRKRYGSILFFKQAWQKPGLTRGALSFAIEGDSIHFDNLLFGIVRSSDTPFLSQEQEDQIRKEPPLESLGEGKTSKSWLWYRYADSEYRYSGGAEMKLKSGDGLEKLLNYYSSKFLEMKKLTPIIDELLLSEKREMSSSQARESAPRKEM